MVRLKGASGATGEKGVKGFQFQYGAIKRFWRSSSNFVAFTFQFQYGAIKSLMERVELLEAKNFNSNMVRLKAHKRNTYTDVRLISIPIWCD